VVELVVKLSTDPEVTWRLWGPWNRDDDVRNEPFLTVIGKALSAAGYAATLERTAETREVVKL
jgi:hypothetical protein